MSEPNQWKVGDRVDMDTLSRFTRDKSDNHADVEITFRCVEVVEVLDNNWLRVLLDTKIFLFYNCELKPVKENEVILDDSILIKEFFGK